MNIIFRKLLITDVVNRKSKLINFKEGDNLITSASNSVGKSVLMKSLYHTLGADSFFDSAFNTDNVLFELEFSNSENLYKILRYKDSFSIFKNNEFINFVKAKDRPSLSTFYLNEFNMSVFLKNRKNITEIAPPAYLFVPYYLDQDRSWKEEQEPFTKSSMNQYAPISKNELYLYHLGLLTKDYGDLKSELSSITDSIDKSNNELSVLDASYKEVKTVTDNSEVIINSDELESLFRSNSLKINKLISKQKELTNKISNLDRIKTNYLIDIRDNERLIKKLQESQNPNSIIVQCPNCHEEFDIELRNEIENVYSSILLENENKSLKMQVEKIETDISKLKEELNLLSKEISTVNKVANDSRSDYEKYVTRIALSSLMDKQLKKIGILSEKVKTLELRKKSIETNLNEIKQKTDSAKNDFCSNYITNLLSLEVTLFSPDKISAFKKISLSGSQYVRSTLAFYFSFLETKESLNIKSFNWPLVIDSPREGEQDDFNSSNILKFIIDNKKSSVQRIIASVDAKKYIDAELLKNINIIELTNNIGSVMNEETFRQNEHYINECIAFFKC